MSQAVACLSNSLGTFREFLQNILSKLRYKIKVIKQFVGCAHVLSNKLRTLWLTTPQFVTPYLLTLFTEDNEWMYCKDQTLFTKRKSVIVQPVRRGHSVSLQAATDLPWKILKGKMSNFYVFGATWPQETLQHETVTFTAVKTVQLYWSSGSGNRVGPFQAKML